MLTEIKKVRQIEGEPNRRWFNNHDMDLIVWQENENILAFQLCYDKTGNEKAISWKPDTGLIHQKVDDGENRPGHYKATPILIQNGSYDLEKIRNDFESYSESISDDIRVFVLDNLIS